MTLNEILNISAQKELKNNEVTEERMAAQLDNMRKLIAFWRMYPDLFVDFIKGPDCVFKFYTYQRVFLRIVMRFKNVYAVFPRAYSKSFLSMLALMLKCILYPGAELFVSTGGKEQAASITLAKITEICKLIPALHNEIDWGRGKSKTNADNVEFIFKNGSKINILAAKESSRGQRRTAGLIEEAILMNGDVLNEVIIPTTNVDRRMPNGKKSPEDEVLNKSLTFITTAGWRNSFPYQKLIETLVNSIIEPDKFFVMGGTYETPVAEGLLNEHFVDELRLSDTFNEDSFDREYNSIWSGDSQNAFYSSEKFNKHRVLNQPEYEYNSKSKGSYYVIGVDVGRIGCTSEACVFKVTPQPNGLSIKTLVNVYSYVAEHFEDQAIQLKKLYFKYRAKAMILDANGLGIGLVDFMVRSQIDPETGEVLPIFGVMNDEEGLYKKFRSDTMERDALYLMKANAAINTEAYSYTQAQLSSGRIKFLIDEVTAKNNLMSSRVGQQMTLEERNQVLIPYQLTTGLRDQMLNLAEEREGVNIILKQVNRGIKKDRFSAFIYGLYFIKQEDEKRNKRHGFNIENFLFFN